MKSSTLQRVAAVDVFRALTMFFMLFVNDIPGLKNVPHWLMHAEMNEDMMGFSDTIFPAFLFCMGMSIPFAIQNRVKKGDTALQIIAHISERTVALIAMGLFMLNCSDVGSISYQWFSILMVIGFFLIWNVYPHTEGPGKYVFKGMKILGIILLAFLVIYKDVHGSPFQQGWWGILGLIGWTYAVCAVIYLFTRESLCKNTIVWIVIILLAVVSHSDLIPWGYGSRIVLLSFIPSDWTLHAFGMSGIITSLIMLKYADRKHPDKFLYILFGLGIVMFVLGLFSHPHWIISKIQATPTWLFYCYVLPTIWNILLVDGCERKSFLVQYHQTCGNGHTHLLCNTLSVVFHTAITGMVLSTCAIQRYPRTTKITRILSHHCYNCRTTG